MTTRFKVSLLVALAVVLYTTVLVFTASRAGAATPDTIRGREVRALVVGDTYPEVTAALGVGGQPVLNDGDGRVVMYYQRVVDGRYANLIFRFAYGELTLTSKYLCGPVKGCRAV